MPKVMMLLVLIPIVMVCVFMCFRCRGCNPPPPPLSIPSPTNGLPSQQLPIGEYFFWYRNKLGTEFQCARFKLEVWRVDWPV